MVKPKRHQVFVSYSHKDRRFLDELLVHLKPWRRDEELQLWADTDLKTGEKWLPAIRNAMAQAKIALFLVSPNFLASDFIHTEEIPALLSAAEEDGLAIFWVPVIPCLIETSPLSQYQAAWSPDRPVGDLRPQQRQKAWVTICRKLKTMFQQDSRKPEKEPDAVFSSPEMKLLFEALDHANREFEDQISSGKPTATTNEKILDLRRQIREGGQRQAGEILLNRYKLIKVVGKGGFAKVWKAYDRERKELVAVKMLHGQYGQDRSRRERFFRGARKMAKLNHPGIVRVIEEKLDEEGFYFFVMEYWDGGNFHQAVLSGTLNEEKVLTVIRTVSAALSHAHQSGLVHRDIKPWNILLNQDGRACLTDFDLVKAGDTTGGTRTHAGMGTFIYAPPELMHDAREAAIGADVYGLGMTMLFALHGKDLTLEVYRDSGSLIDSLSCATHLKKAIARAVDWKPENRFESVAAFCTALEPPRTSSIKSTELNLNADPSSQMVGEVQESKRWVCIQPGKFIMGDDQGHWDDEKPAHSVGITEGFWMGRYPITNRDFRRFIEADGYKQPRYWPEEGWKWLQLKGKTYDRWYVAIKKKYEKVFTYWDPKWFKPGSEPLYWEDSKLNGEDQPVVGISWFEAKAYCAWVSEWLQRHPPSWWTGPSPPTVSLPTEAQWEYAARGSENRKYPWGDQPEPNEKLANFKSNIGKTTAVGTYPDGKTPEGVHDMAGNVWEWCEDTWSKGLYKERKSGEENPINQNGDAAVRVLRGGAWGNGAGSLRASVRGRYRVWRRSTGIGFRCVLSGRSPERG